MAKLVIFDLDGTLLDTIADLGDATNHSLHALGFPTHPLSAYNKMVGNGIAKLLERSLPETARTPQNLAAMKVEFFAYYGQHLCDHTVPYPGIPDLLSTLTCKGIKVAVASNKYQAGVDILIRRFFPSVPWAAVRGQREGIPVKPDPAIVDAIVETAHVNKGDVLYVGDSGVDMLTARNAAVMSCGVTWGFRSLEELQENGAMHIARTSGEILGLAEK